jgi:hypothetical protein
MIADFLSALEPLEIFKFRQQFDAAVRVSGTAPVKMIPGNVCDEIAGFLYLLELAARQRSDLAGVWT